MSKWPATAAARRCGLPSSTGNPVYPEARRACVPRFQLAIKSVVVLGLQVVVPGFDLLSNGERPIKKGVPKDSLIRSTQDSGFGAAKPAHPGIRDSHAPELHAACHGFQFSTLGAPDWQDKT